MDANAHDAIRRFIDDARTILARGADDAALERLAVRMRALVGAPAVLAEHRAFLARLDSEAEGPRLYADTGRRSELLHTEPSGLTLVRSRFDPQQATPVHSHGTWGVLGVYAGRDLHRAYLRRDGDDGAGPADLEMIEERVLEAGDVALIPRPPQDIHAQRGYGGEAAYELVLFGRNAMVVPRLVFDLERGTAREVVPGRS